MRIRHHLWFVILALPLTGCGGCGGSPDPRNAAPPDDGPPEEKKPAELFVRLQAATTLPRRGELPPALLTSLEDDSPHVRRAAVFTIRRSGAEAKVIAAALTPLLKDRNLFVRVVAAEALWEAEKSPDALTALKLGMRDNNPHVRTRAIRALGDVGPAAKDVAPELTAMLKQKDPEMRQVVAEALALIKFADVPALAEAMAVAQVEAAKSGDYRVHRALHKVFEAMGPDAVPALIEMMKKNDDPYQQKIAALALAALGQHGQPAVPALIGLLKVRKYNTHQTAADVLGRLGVAAEPALLHLMELLDDDDPDTARQAAVALGGIGKPALQTLMVRLRSKKAKNDLATVALAKLGKDAVPPLLAALQSEDPTIRLRAALALGDRETPPKEVLPVLLTLLKEWTEPSESNALGVAIGTGSCAARRRDSLTARRLVTAMGRFRGDTAEPVAVLIPLLKDRASALRLVTVQALGALGQTARPAIPELRPLLADEDKTTRFATATALLAITLDKKEDVPALIDLLKTEDLDSTTLTKTAERLGRIGPDARDAVPSLMHLLPSSTGKPLEFAIVLSIGRIGKEALPQVVQAVRAKSKTRWKQSIAFIRLGKDGRAVLRQWLMDEEEELRAIAARRLGFFGPAPEAVEPLLDALKDLDADVRACAALSLFPVGTNAERAVPALTVMLLDPKDQVRSAVAEALGSYGPAARLAVPKLIEALQDESPVVSTSVRTALQQIGVGRANVAALTALLRMKGESARHAAHLLRYCVGDASEAIPALREMRKEARYEDQGAIALWHVAQDSQVAGWLLDRLQHSEDLNRAHAVAALASKSPGVNTMVPALTDALRDRNPRIADSAADALREMGESSRPALPDLLVLLKREENGQMNHQALQAIARMGREAREAAPTLKALLKTALPSDQAELRGALWQIEADQSSITALVALLANNDACGAAAVALGEIGSPAKDAVTALRAQLDNLERNIWQLYNIEEALRKIEGK